MNHYCFKYNRGKNEEEVYNRSESMHLLRNQMKGKYVALKRTAEDRKE